MKIISDSFKNADNVLLDLQEFKSIMMDMSDFIAPFEEAANGRTFPRFVSETSTGLRKSLIKDFEVRFPAIKTLVSDGMSEKRGLSRLHDACFKFKEVQDSIYKAKCMVLDDEVRADLSCKLFDAVADVLVFIITQYSLNTLGNGEIVMSVQNYCEHQNITPDVFYGQLLQELKWTGRSWYAYESISPYYAELMEMDSVFVSECEENFYPLNDELAVKLLNGDVDVAYVRGLMLESNSSSEEIEVDMTPATLISQMRLQ